MDYSPSLKDIVAFALKCCKFLRILWTSKVKNADMLSVLNIRETGA